MSVFPAVYRKRFVIIFFKFYSLKLCHSLDCFQLNRFKISQTIQRLALLNNLFCMGPMKAWWVFHEMLLTSIISAVMLSGSAWLNSCLYPFWTQMQIALMEYSDMFCNMFSFSLILSDKFPCVMHAMMHCHLYFYFDTQI